MQGGVRKKGSTWYYYFEAGKVNGKRKKIERKGGSTKKEALEALRKAIIEFENTGNYIQESNISVSDYFDYWFKEYVMLNCKFNTQDYYKRIINNHIKKDLGMYRLKQVTPSILQEFINLKFRNGLSKSSLSNMRGILTKSFRMAVYPYQFIKSNPAEYIQLPKYDEIKKDAIKLKIITIDEFERILKRFPEGSTFYIPLQIAFHTGMRAGEVCGLTWDCVDFSNNTIRVEKQLLSKGKGIHELASPKTATSNRTIAIGKTLVDILKKHKINQSKHRLEYGELYKNSNFVCTKENGDCVTTDSIKYLSRVINYELGINFKFHSLRHTHATMLLESGAIPKDIQERLGHSKLATTSDTYSHVTNKMRSETVTIFEKIISTHSH